MKLALIPRSRPKWIVPALLLLPVAYGVRVGVLAYRAQHSAHPHGYAHDPGHEEDSEGRIGRSLSDIVLPSVSGGEIRLAEFRGKYLLLDFWATWCPGCVAEWPEMRAWRRKILPLGLEILPVSVDEGGKPVVDRFLRSRPWEGPLALDPEMSFADRVGHIDLPYGVLLDPQGRIVGLFPGTDRQEIAKAFWADRHPALKAALDSRPALPERPTSGGGYSREVLDKPKALRSSQLSEWIQIRGEALSRPPARALWKLEGVEWGESSSGIRMTATQPVGFVLLEPTGKLWNMELEIETRRVKGRDYGLGQMSGVEGAEGLWATDAWDMGGIHTRAFTCSTGSAWPSLPLDSTWQRWRVRAYPHQLSIRKNRREHRIPVVKRSGRGAMGLVLLGRGTTVEIRSLRLKGDPNIL